MPLASPAVLTLAEFLALDDIDASPAWEYSHGTALQKPMGGLKHSLLQKRLVGAIESSNTDPVNPYEAFPELRCTLNDRSVVPDISVLRRQDVSLTETGEVSSQELTFAPLWVIEVLSPGQNQTKVTSNILYCLRHGAVLGWLIDPEARAVIVYQRDRLPDVLTGTKRLPVLPGMTLVLTAEQLFDWLQR